MSKDYKEIATELTLAIVDKIRPTSDSTVESRNKSLAEEVASAYNTIYEAINRVSECSTMEPNNEQVNSLRELSDLKVHWKNEDQSS